MYRYTRGGGGFGSIYKDRARGENVFVNRT